MKYRVTIVFIISLLKKKTLKDSQNSIEYERAKYDLWRGRQRVGRQGVHG